MWICESERELKLYTLLFDPAEVQKEITIIQEMIEKEDEIVSVTQAMGRNSIELGAIVNHEIKECIENETNNLQQKVQDQLYSMKQVLNELAEMTSQKETFSSSLAFVQKSIDSASVVEDEEIVIDFEAARRKYEEIQNALKNLGAASESLNNLENRIVLFEGKMFYSSYQNKISIHRQVIDALHKGLKQYSNTLAAALNKQHFEEMHKLFLTWTQEAKERIDFPLNYLPENTNERMAKNFREELSRNKQNLEDLKFLGERAMKSEEISDILVTCNCTVAEIEKSVDFREQSMEKTSSKKIHVNLLQKEFQEFLMQSQQYLQSPVQFTEISLEEIDGFIQDIQCLQEKINSKEESLSTLLNNTQELVAESGVFSSYNKRQLFHHSTRELSDQWCLMRAMVIQRTFYLRNVRNLWAEMLGLLNNLANWLTCKELIASEVNYSESTHSRNVYLEGIKTFENLNHSIQDNINLLRDVNSCYHKLAKKELDVNNYLQGQVLALSERWHRFYDKVSDTCTVIRNVLQMWEEYDQLHQHLNVFLTESEIKITELEHSDTLNQEVIDSLMEEFNCHEDWLERYMSMGNNLKQKNTSSAADITYQMEEIQKHWVFVYGCLLTYKERIAEAKLQKDDLQNQSTLLEPATIDVLPICDTEATSEIIPMDVDDPQLKDFLIEQVDKTEQTVLQATAEMNDEFDGKEAEIEKSTVIGDLSEIGDEHIEFVKDLLAALQEAEDRMESLETVLSEPTPCGSEDDNGPNYSRLLAACRSSIDVIQHLYHLLSEHPSHTQSIPREIDIQSRTEGMLNRWEKIESAALNKEFRALENGKRWQGFSKELNDIEEWLVDTLEENTSQEEVEADMDKFITLLQNYQALISTISSQRTTIITLNVQGQKFTESFKGKQVLATVNEKLKAVNEHWDKLCHVALEWQTKLQTKFLQSPELHNTISELELWLKDSEDRVRSVSLTGDYSDRYLHAQYTEIYALKQQLEKCSHRLRTLVDMSKQLFCERESSGDAPPCPSEGIESETQSRLQCILDVSQSLLLECTEKLQSLSTLLSSQMVSQERIAAFHNPELQNDGRIKKCCNFLLRVARASFPIQAVLLLLLGAAILLPKEEEELGCRFSNNFANSLNPMLRFPDGPPPV